MAKAPCAVPFVNWSRRNIMFDCMRIVCKINIYNCYQLASFGVRPSSDFTVLSKDDELNSTRTKSGSQVNYSLEFHAFQLKMLEA